MYPQKENPNKDKAYMLARQIAKTEDAPSRILETCDGHALSPKNSRLALAQNPKATKLGGFKQWQVKGFQVKKGEKALYINAAHVFQTEGGQGISFKLVPMFDASQVEKVEESV